MTSDRLSLQPRRQDRPVAILDRASVEGLLLSQQSRIAEGYIRGDNGLFLDRRRAMLEARSRGLAQFPFANLHAEWLLYCELVPFEVIRREE